MNRRHAIALLALTACLRVVSLVRPCLSDDEATYAVVGREMLRGRVLYRDVVDHKPPAIYLVNAATQAAGGPIGGMILLHALLILAVWGTGLLVARIVRRHGRADATWMAALLWCVFSTTMVDVDGLAANCELIMMLPLVASVAVYLDARDRVLPLVGVGALVGVAMLFKYQAGIQLPLFGVAWIYAQRKHLARAATGALALGVGVAIPIAAVGAYLAAIGGLDAAWFWFRFNFSYIDAGSSRAEMIVRLVVRGGFIAASSALVYVCGLIGAWRGRRTHRFLVEWLAASAIAVFVGGRFFGHYFHQLTAPLAVLGAPIAVDLYARRRSITIASMAVPAAIFLALGALHDPMMRAAGQPDPDYAQVVSWLDAHARPDDAICIWGNSPVLYFDADRPLGCRFVFANYLTGLSPATATQTDASVDSSANIVPQAWDMLETDLRARKPPYIIDASPGDVGFYGKYPPSKFPRLAKILACDYAPAADVIGMRIYARTSTSSCDGR